MEKLFTFANHVYKGFDSSHDLIHGWKVYDNVMEIIKHDKISATTEESEELMYIAILHDGIDHKYIDKGIPFEEFKQFFIDHLGLKRANKCLHIIQNISWSKEVKGKNIPLEKDDWMRKIIQDADWLEALGDVGLQRCIDYSHEINVKNIPENVCHHIEEKLLKIPDQLHYPYAKKVAYERIEPLQTYLDVHKT